MKTFSLFIRVLGLSTALMTGAAHAADLKPGDPAPDFTLQGSDGKTYRLADFKGKKPVVLAWFPKAFTRGCTAECKSIREDGAALRELDVAYFTASTDTPEDNKRFAESLELDYPILSDPSGEVARAYGVVNDQRRVSQRWTFYIGEDGRIQLIDKEINTSGAGQEIAANLKELNKSATP